MRPIYLKMSAFGPFIQEECVDFDRLSQNGLFLITGQTGAGKTTIFDAITFALYGEASGSNRNVATLRNDLAKDEETYVELTFQLHGSTYTIKRSPTYTKPGRKTPLNAKAILTLEDGSMIEGPKEVNKKILDLLGLDVNQFKQIAMIAQGEFTKLLFASSNEKEVIFRKIFNTFKYDRFEMELKEMVNRLSQQLRDTKTKMQTLRDTIDLPYDGDDDAYLTRLKERIETTKQIANEMQEKCNQLYQQISNQKTKLDAEQKTNEAILHLQKLTRTLQELVAKAPIYQKKEATIQQIDQANAIVPFEVEVIQLQKQFNQTKQNIQELERTLKSKESVYIQIQANYDLIPDLKKKIGELDGEIVVLNKMVEDRNLKKELENKKRQYQNYLDTLHSKLNQYVELKEELDQDHQAYQQRLETEKTYAIRKDEVEAKLNLITKKIAAYEQVIALRRKYQQAKEKHQRLSIQFSRIDEIYSQASSLLQEHERTFYHMQAGILASTLKEGMPCPVCGSIHHPSLAVSSITSITSDSLEEEKKQLEGIKQKREETFQLTYQANLSISKIEDQINMIIQSNELENETKETLIFNYQQIEKENGRVQQAISNIPKIERYLKQIEVNQTACLKDIETLQQDINNSTSDMSKIDGQIAQIGLIDDRLDERINYVNTTNSQLKNQVKTFEGQHQKMIDEQGRLNGQIASYQQSIETINLTLKEKTPIWMKKLEEFGTYEIYLTYKAQIPSLPALRQEVRQYEMSLERIKGEIKAIQLERTEMMDLTSLKDQISKNEKSYQEALNQQNSISTTLTNYRSTYQQLNQMILSSGDQIKQYNRYYELYSVVKGDNPQKLSFERYILSAYFEQIILLANVRLKEMTNHRYALIRKEEKSAGQSGLDLLVKDYQSGTIRDIKSLSGGESFKAALSLALGLSDMIQNTTGGIELNTLFIDEGFGSLDQESLDQAISVLMSLQESNKMIGIISHVTELKQRIDNQLVVLKDQKGSYIQIQ